MIHKKYTFLCKYFVSEAKFAALKYRALTKSLSEQRYRYHFVGLLFLLLLQGFTSSTAFALTESSIKDASSTNSAFTLEEATIDSVHSAFKTNEITCQSLVQAYLERIQKYNLSVNEKPPINALTEINPYVLEQAKKLDDDFEKTKALTGPLHCVPIILKDNIDSFDTMTTAGSFAMLGNQPIQDAFLVAKLRDAGAIILAKGGMDEFGWSLFGISSRTGRIGNAYDTTQNPGGSSAGVAAAISANFGLIGFGTDNAGSIRIPSAFNGVHGLRPSTGLVSQRGVFPMGNLDAVAGPITRTIKDLALVLQVIASEADPLDPKTQNAPRVKNYTPFLNDNGLKGKRLGIIRQVGNHDTFANMPNEILKIFNQAFQNMQAQGAILIENINLTDYDLDRTFNQAGETEDLNDYFQTFPGTRQSFQDICQSDRTRTFGKVKECLKFVRDNPRRNSTEYTQVLNTVQKNKNYVENVMQQNQLDALILPVAKNGSATYDPYSINTWYSPVASNAGLPGIVINAGYDPRPSGNANHSGQTSDSDHAKNFGISKNNLPVGFELIGKQYQEGQLLELAYAYEQHSPARIPPSLQTSSLKLKLNKQQNTAEMNNLFTLLGQDAYEKVLKDLSWRALTPERFNTIFMERIKDWNNNEES